MNDEERRIQLVDRGKRAEALLGDPLVMAAFEGLRNELRSQLRRVATPDDAFRISLTLNAIDDVQESLRIAVTMGVDAAVARLREQQKTAALNREEAALRQHREAARRARAVFDDETKEAVN